MSPTKITQKKGPITRSHALKLRRGHGYTGLVEKGAVMALHQLKSRKPLSEREIESETGIPHATASRLIRNAERSAAENRENHNPIALENLLPGAKSGRPRKFDDAQRKLVIEYATRNASQRRKPWTTITKELPFSTHHTQVSKILREAGYNRCVAESKPKISEKNLVQRKHFSNYWKDRPVTTDQKGADAFDGFAPMKCI